MGEIKKVLAARELPDREPHNGRLFVDLSEQVHIHYREMRNQFSVGEFFEYADVVARSAKDLKHYLYWHPEYEEQKVFDNIVVALGPLQQTRPLSGSPEPHRTTYFNNRLQIELQAEGVIDEVHIHYRDYRLVMNRDTFCEFASAMTEAKGSMEQFLNDNEYVRIMHPFRKAVVEDGYFESKKWAAPGGNAVSLKQRCRALAYYIGGDRLVRIGGRFLGSLKRALGGG